MKTKIVTLLEIAIVLCSVFLVATLPAIAADQTTQKASASEVTTASEDDFVLGIYGNANEDDTIDMRDLTYVKLIFFGKKPETELGDAKYDGEINPLDFVQIKLIIVGKEKELTLVDTADRIVTVKKPVERTVILIPPNAEAIRILDATDNVVGVSSIIASKGGKYKNYEIFFPMLSKLPTVGLSPPDYEAILSLNPDIVIESGYVARIKKDQEHLPGITVIGLSFIAPEYMKEEMKKLGYILDKKKEAEEFIDWYDSYLKVIKERTVGLSEDKKPRVYFGRYDDIYTTFAKPSMGPFDELCEITCGRYISANLPAAWEKHKKGKHGVYKVDPEWVIEQNPDIIIVATWAGVRGGYATDDPSEMKEVRDGVMNRPELANVKAVKNERVYVIDFDIWASPAVCSVAPTYYAKWFHPDLFEDLDPKAIHQEYLTRFQRFDYDPDKHGVFVYPPFEG